MKTIEVTDDVYSKLSSLARDSGKSLSEVIEDLIRARIELRVERLIEAIEKPDGTERLRAVVDELRGRPEVEGA